MMKYYKEWDITWVIPSPPQPQVTKPNKSFPSYLVNMHYITKIKHSHEEAFQIQTGKITLYIVLLHYHHLPQWRTEWGGILGGSNPRPEIPKFCQS
jgi:hypothetical protein